METGLNQITGFALAFFIGNSTLSTDSRHEYKWCLASNKRGVMSCSITQITKATSWWQTSRPEIMPGDNSDTDGMLIVTISNSAAINSFVSIMNSGDKTRYVARLEEQSSAATGASSHDETIPL